MIKALVVKLFVLLALVVSAFAHNAALPSQRIAGYDQLAYAAQYRLPDGTLPVLCAVPGAPQHSENALCDFCLIAGGLMLADPAADAEPIFQIGLSAARLPSQSASRSRQLYRIHAPLRAPPANMA